MRSSGGIDSGEGAGLRTAVEGIAWPAILPDAGAHLLAINFQLERSQWWPDDVLRRHQLKQLRELLRHAVKVVPYYHQEAYRAWLRRPDREAWAAFGELPLISRRTAQDAGDTMFATTLPAHHGDVSEDETSGSTGVPLRYRNTTLAGFFWDAISLREHFWHRRDFSARHAFIRSRPAADLGPAWGAPSNIVFSCGESANLPIRCSLSEKRDWLRSLNPRYLMTTPSTLRALAEIALKGDLPLPDLVEARTVGETVTQSLRDLVKHAWGAKLTDVYSTSEVGLLALQCPTTAHYHVQSEWAIVEILDPQGKPCPPGQVGRIVVSPLHNFAMPLLRYDTGDFAEVGERCACGRGLRSLVRILGRRRNRLFLPNGDTSWPNLSSLPWVELAPALHRFQLLQRRDHSLQLRYEASRPFTPGERDSVCGALLDHLRCTLPLTVERVGALPLSEAGKLEDFITEIEEARETGS